MKKILTIILLLLSLHLSLWAQKGLAIQAAFDELAVRKNATEVVLSGKRLKNFHLSLFHSLEIKIPRPLTVSTSRCWSRLMPHRL